MTLENMVEEVGVALARGLVRGLFGSVGAPKESPAPASAPAPRRAPAARRRAAKRPASAAKEASEAKAPSSSASFKVGDSVLYKQGRGTFPAKVVSVDAKAGRATVQRSSDGKRVARPFDKLEAQG